MEIEYLHSFKASFWMNSLKARLFLWDWDIELQYCFCFCFVSPC